MQEQTDKKPKNMVNWRETVESYLTRVVNRYRSNCLKDGSYASPDFLQQLTASIAEDQAPAKVTRHSNLPINQSLVVLLRQLGAAPPLCFTVELVSF